MKIEKQFEYDGYPCVITLAERGYRCGYVGVIPNNKLYGKIDKTVTSLSCHRGVSYIGGGPNSTTPIQSDFWWIGFDCTHIGDLPDLKAVATLYKDEFGVFDRAHNFYQLLLSAGGDDAEVRSLDYVTQECKKLVQQIKKYEQ